MDRRAYLGGTDIAAILGVSPWKTALELYEEKIADEYIEPVIEPTREKMFRRGKKLEPWVVELLEEERGIFVVKRNQRYVDPEFPYMTCEVDFEYMDEIGLCNGDVKTVSPFAASEWGEQGTDEIPLAYCLQFLWGQMVTNRPATLVGVLIGADDLRVYEVKRDEELIAEMRRRAIEFWTGNVIPRVPPAPQNSSDTVKLLARYGGFVSPGSQEVWDVIDKLREVKAELKTMNEQKETLEGGVKQALLVEAQALGIEGTPDKFVILGPDGKKAASLTKQHRAAYQVKESDFYVLRS